MNQAGRRTAVLTSPGASPRISTRRRAPAALLALAAVVVPVLAAVALPACVTSGEGEKMNA